MQGEGQIEEHLSEQWQWLTWKGYKRDKVNQGLPAKKIKKDWDDLIKSGQYQVREYEGTQAILVLTGTVLSRLRRVWRN